MTAARLVDVVKTVGSGPGRQRVLEGVELDVPEASAVAVVGRSGSGKSTLLSLLGLLDRPDSGSVSINGTRTDQLSDRQLAQMRSEHIGFVYQRFFLLGHLSAYRNVATALLHGDPAPRSGRRDRVMGALREVGLADKARRRPAELSGGEQQRVAIARALVRRPTLLLADEPTGALDAATAETILELLFAAGRQPGRGLVVVTHDDDVAALADRTVRLVDGRAVG